MNLDFDVQLQVALRALEEVVAPALGGAEKHVVEQLHLAMATIGFVKTRMPDVRRYARMELTGLARLADDALACVGGDATLATASAKARALLADPEADTADYEAISRHLRDVVTALGSRCADPKAQAAIDWLVLDHGGTLLAQARQWTTPFGFELKPEDLPPPAW